MAMKPGDMVETGMQDLGEMWAQNNKNSRNMPFARLGR
jgi:hypothetical protein